MNNMQWGLEMTALGMGLVFALLAMLWGLLVLVLKLDPPPMGDADEAAATASVANDTAHLGVAREDRCDPALVAAIVMAIRAHQRKAPRSSVPTTRLEPPETVLHNTRWANPAARTRQNMYW